MKVIDLTHTIRENMPVYPGTEPPKLSPTSSYESDGFKDADVHPHGDAYGSSGTYFFGENHAG